MSDENYIKLIVLAAIVSNDYIDKTQIVDFVDYVERIRLSDNDIESILKNLEKENIINKKKKKYCLVNKIKNKVNNIDKAKEIASNILED